LEVRGERLGSGNASQLPASNLSPLDKRKFEFLMVKLLRAYGECLGARSR
jgi:hypothetical protein